MKQFFSSLFQFKKYTQGNMFEIIFLCIVLFIAPISFILLKLVGISSVQGLLFTGIVWLGLLYLLLSVIIQGKFLIPKKYSLYSILGIILYTLFQVITFSSVSFSFGTTSSLLDHPLIFITFFIFTLIVGVVSSGQSFLRRFFFILGVITSLVILHTLVFNISGWQFLSLGFSSNSGMNIFGSWSDLNIISLLLLVASFVYAFFAENSFQKKFMWIFGITGLLGMIFTTYHLGWVLLGLFSLCAIFMAFFKAQNNLQTLFKKDAVVLIPVVLFLISLIFIIGNSFITNPVQSLTGVSVQEIRPSFSATYEILIQLPMSQIFIGSGLGTFENVWFQYLNPQVMQTSLWNTGFPFAFGYVPTFLITFGVIGFLLMILLFSSIFIDGYQSLVHARKEDRGIVSFLYVITLFSLPLLIFTIPSMIIFILLFLFMGILLGFSYLSPKQMYAYDIFSFHSIWKRFVSLAVILCLVIVCVYVLFAHVRYFRSLQMIQKSTLALNNNNPEESILYIQRAQSYVRNNYDIHMMIAQSSFIILQSSFSEKLTQEFIQTIVQASLSSLQKAITLQPKKHQPYVLLGDFYTLLYGAGLEDALSIAKESYQKSLDFRPYNPYVLFVQAKELFIGNSVEEGRLKLDELFTLHSFDASFFQKAGLLEEQFGSLIRAESYFKQAVFLEKNQLNTWVQLISFYVRSELLDKAEEILIFLVREYPQNIDVRILVAQFFVDRGNITVAQEHIDFLRQYENESSQLKEFLINLQNRKDKNSEIIIMDALSENSEDNIEEQIIEGE